MTTYEYTLLVGGYRWNVLQRIFNTIGIMPLQVADINGSTVVVFQDPLSQPNKALLDQVMADNPQFPPTTTNTVFEVKDLWEFRDQLAQSMGLTFKIYYAESVLGSGVVDMIRIVFDKVLTTQEKNKVINAYQSSINLKA